MMTTNRAGRKMDQGTGPLKDLDLNKESIQDLAADEAVGVKGGADTAAPVRGDTLAGRAPGLDVNLHRYIDTL